MATFIVNPTEQALILRFGQPVRDLIDAPGLYFKWPFVDTVVYIDKRILALDNERQEVLVSDNQRLEVDAFVRYHIADPLLFYQSVFNTRGADAQLGGMLNSALRRSLSGASITDIVRDKRDALMADIRDQMIVGAKRFGLDVIDVRIKRADLPAENSEAVFRRMQTERQQRAASYRAQGSQQSQQIKAEADRKVTVITATAQQQSEQIPRRGRRRAQPHLRRGLWRRPGFLRLLPLHASLSEQLRQRADASAHQSEVGLLPVFLYPHAAAGSPVGAVSRGPVPGGGGESGLKCATSAPRSGWCSRLKDC